MTTSACTVPRVYCPASTISRTIKRLYSPLLLSSYENFPHLLVRGGPANADILLLIGSVARFLTRSLFLSHGKSTRRTGNPSQDLEIREYRLWQSSERKERRRVEQDRRGAGSRGGRKRSMSRRSSCWRETRGWCGERRAGCGT